MKCNIHLLLFKRKYIFLFLSWEKKYVQILINESQYWINEVSNLHVNKEKLVFNFSYSKIVHVLENSIRTKTI